MDFISKLLPVKDIKIYDKNGKIYKRAKFWRVRGILIELSKELNITHEEEYELIYKPLDRFLYARGLAIYNMWGYGEGMPWQMDGRHARGVCHVVTKDGEELKKRLEKLKKEYKEITKSLTELSNIKRKP